MLEEVLSSGMVLDSWYWSFVDGLYLYDFPFSQDKDFLYQTFIGIPLFEKRHLGPAFDFGNTIFNHIHFTSLLVDHISRCRS